MKLSVLIVTIDRLLELEQCVASLSMIDDLIEQIIIMANHPTEPWNQEFRDQLFRRSPKAIIIDSEERLSCAAARNTMAYRASSSLLLILDDDAYLINDQAVRRSVKLMEVDGQIGAIAFAQCSSDGELPVGFTQPGPREELCYTCGFGGFANVIRREVFNEVGGFQAILEVAGEENEMCRRIWAAGFSVVYVPDRSICHAPSEISRDMTRRAMLTARNRLLDGLLNEPWYILPLTLPLRFLHAARFLRGFNVWHKRSTRTMMAYSARSLWSVLRPTLKARRPISLRHHLKWEMIKRRHPVYGR